MAYIVNKNDLVKYRALQESKAVEKQKNYEVKETLLFMSVTSVITIVLAFIFTIFINLIKTIL
jgi:signal transduction histidine kinase